MRKQKKVEETMQEHGTYLSDISGNLTREVCAFMKQYVNAKLYEMAELNRLEWAKPSDDSALQAGPT